MGIGRLWKPDTFQGEGRKSDYFEGWYFKLIDKNQDIVLGVIPGISIGKNGNNAHSFIQFIDAVSGETEYFTYPVSKFRSDKKTFFLRIGGNVFTDSGIQLDLYNENIRISGELTFANIVKFPSSFFSPGIMGPFSFVPGMECYHGVVNIRHTISGSLSINGIWTDLTGGEGYIEKDWGKSFPQSWIWIQANHFYESGVSFMFSVARIPFLGKHFIGLIAFLRTEKGFYKFATYNGSSLEVLTVDQNRITGILKNIRYTLRFTVEYTSGGILKAPSDGFMNRDIEETITAHASINLKTRDGKTVYQGESNRAGVEIVGNLSEILQHAKRNEK